MSQDEGILHEASTNPGPLFQPGKLYSLLDILGGGTMTCDNCGRWQRIVALSPSMARADLVKYGWSFRDGKDLCPVCTKLTTDNGQLTTDKGAL